MFGLSQSSPPSLRDSSKSCASLASSPSSLSVPASASAPRVSGTGSSVRAESWCTRRFIPLIWDTFPLRRPPLTTERGAGKRYCIPISLLPFHPTSTSSRPSPTGGRGGGGGGELANGSRKERKSRRESDSRREREGFGFRATRLWREKCAKSPPNSLCSQPIATCFSEEFGRDAAGSTVHMKVSST